MSVCDCTADNPCPDAADMLRRLEGLERAAICVAVPYPDGGYRVLPPPRPETKYPPRICIQCGGEYTKIPTEGVRFLKRRFCSRACALASGVCSPTSPLRRTV